MRVLPVRGATPAAFDGRCIPPRGVAPPSNIPDILGRRAWRSGRLGRLGATRALHHGLVALILVVVSAVSVGAQSLGDVARKEAERRKTVKTKGKTYTNDQLKSDPRDAAAPTPSTVGPATPAAGTPAAGSGSAKAGSDAGAQKDQAAAGTKDAPKDEAYWRARLQTERDGLSRAQMFAEALQSRINGLSADFTARDDPAQRAAVGADRQKSLDELQRVKKEIDQHTKALTEIQEEARRSGAPAGWLR
jgi:hypothetical protein